MLKTKKLGRIKNTCSNSTFAIGGVSCSTDSLAVAESFVLRINISGNNPTHRKSANRYRKPNLNCKLNLLYGMFLRVKQEIDLNWKGMNDRYNYIYDFVKPYRVVRWQYWRGIG